MPTNHTQNYQLSQWVKSDQVKMGDFNADNAKLDAALHGLAQTAAAHTSALSKLGNCQLYYTTYTGDGQDTRTLTFPHRPILVVGICGNRIIRTVWGAGAIMCWPSPVGGGESYVVVWSDNSLTMSGLPANTGPNEKNQVYHLVVLMDAAH